jgi:hypothetical protein
VPRPHPPKLERDHGISRNKQQRNDTYLRRKINRATGMTEGRLAFHPELANQIFNAIDREIAAMIAAGNAPATPNSSNAATSATGSPPKHSADSSPAATTANAPRSRRRLRRGPPDRRNRSAARAQRLRDR